MKAASDLAHDALLLLRLVLHACTFDQIHHPVEGEIKGVQIQSLLLGGILVEVDPFLTEVFGLKSRNSGESGPGDAVSSVITTAFR